MFDQALFLWIHDWAGKSRLLDLLMIFLADYSGYFLVLAALYLIFKNKEWRARYSNLAFLALALIISRGLLTEIIRFVYPKSRPFMELGFTPLMDHDPSSAFPSGHAAFFFALSLAMFYIVDAEHRRWPWIFLLAACLMSFARVFAGVHWPLDILAGFIVAVIGVLVSRSLLKKYRN